MLCQCNVYKTDAFADALIGALKTMTTRDLAKIAKQKDAASRAKRLKLTTPAPDGFLRLSDDGKYILYPDGRRFFMIGCNYLGSFDRKCHIGGGCSTSAEWKTTSPRPAPPASTACDFG